MLGTPRDVKGGVEVLIEGSLEVKLPTIWTDEKQRWSRRIEKRRAEERRSEKRKSQKKEDVGACVFPMFCVSGGSKSRLAKAAGAEPSGQMRDDKLHAVAARSTFQSQNAQNTLGPDHFWQLRCRKSAHCCGAKHISKSKATKHTSFGPRLEVQMSKKCTQLWREAHFEVKMLKTPGVRTTFGSSDVVKVHAVVARSTFRSQNVKNTRVRTTFGRSDVPSRGRRKGLWTLSKVRKTSGFCGIFKYNHHYTSLHSNTLHYNYDYTFPTFHYTTLHYAPLHSTTLQYTPLHSTTLQYTQLHSITFNYAQLHSITLTCVQLHSITLNYAQFHSIPLTQLH